MKATGHYKNNWFQIIFCFNQNVAMGTVCDHGTWQNTLRKRKTCCSFEEAEKLVALNQEAKPCETDQEAERHHTSQLMFVHSSKEGEINEEAARFFQESWVKQN